MPGPSARAFGPALRRSPRATPPSLRSRRPAPGRSRRAAEDTSSSAASSAGRDRHGDTPQTTAPAPRARPANPPCVSSRSGHATARSPGPRIGWPTARSLHLRAVRPSLDPPLTHNHPVKVSLRTHVNSLDVPGITSRFQAWRLFGAGVRAPERSPPWASRRSPAEVRDWRPIGRLSGEVGRPRHNLDFGHGSISASWRVTRTGWLGSSWRQPASPQRGSVGSGGVALRASTPATPEL